MELGALIVFLAVFAGCGVVVFAVSFFGTQSETFEEALEKQRNQQKKVKEKKKENKPSVDKKKKAKKGKEVKNNNVTDFEEETVLVDPAGEVVEPVYIEPVKEEPKVEEVKIEKTKKEKKREEKVVAKTVVPPPAPVVEEVVPVKAAPVVAEAAPKAAAPVIAEPVPVQEPAPVVAKEQPKPEKKKIEIQEVVAVEEKKSKKSAKSAKQPKKSNYDEVLETVRRIKLSSSEAQGIVDVLLMKQTGAEADDAEGDWVEPGKETEAKKSARQLAEVTEQLEEEKNKSSGLEKKMATIRKEMTDNKSQLNVLKREMEELNRKKTLETNNYNTTLQQLKVELNTSQTRHIQMEAKYQQEVRTIQEQLASAQQNAAPTDSNLVAELEKVKSECAQLTQTNSTLHHQYTQKCSEGESVTASLQQQLKEIQTKTSGESSQLAEQLTVAQKAREQLEAQLETANKTKTSLSEENTKLQGLLEQAKSKSTPDTSSQVTSQLESQLSAITAAKVQLQSELTTLKEKLSDKEVETSRLMEENERLSEQVASSVERPAAEGEEAVNGHSEVNHTQQVVAKEVPVSSGLEEQYSKLSVQLKQRESRCEELETELSDNNLELQKLQSKNDEVSAAYEQYKAECMSMLGNLFPADCTASKSLATIQTKASQFIQDLENKAGDASRVESLLEDIQKLETQSVSYKTILSQTENMLTTLQSSVEGAELEWKKKLETSQSECSDLKKKVGDMESKNSELLAKLKDTCSLSEQLTAEKSSKDQLAKKCSELQQLLALGEKQLKLANSQEEVLTNGGGESEA